MGTRALTHLYDEDGDEIVVMYTHRDGYPSHHGQQLVAEAIKLEKIK